MLFTHQMINLYFYKLQNIYKYIIIDTTNSYMIIIIFIRRIIVFFSVSFLVYIIYVV